MAKTPITEAHIERFWGRVAKTPTCWNWTGAKIPAGYGAVRIGDDFYYAHRLSYMLTQGEIPEGMKVDHKCHNPSCINPKHLRLTTNKQNAENHQGPISTNTSGYRGVWWLKSRSRWIAEVKHNGVKYRAGTYKTAAEANLAAVELRNRLYTHNDIDRIAC